MKFRRHRHEPCPGQEPSRRRACFSLIRIALMLIGILTVLYFAIVYVLMPILARMS